MRVVFAVVWLLSNGSFEGEPWKYFDTLRECEDYSTASMPRLTPDKLRFFTMCADLDAETIAEFSHFTIKDFKKEEK